MLFFAISTPVLYTQPLVISEGVVTVVNPESVCTSRALLANFDAMTLQDKVSVMIKFFKLHF